jgi:hypothetical protein
MDWAMHDSWKNSTSLSRPVTSAKAQSAMGHHRESQQVIITIKMQPLLELTICLDGRRENSASLVLKQLQKLFVEQMRRVNDSAKRKR